MSDTPLQTAADDAKAAGAMPWRAFWLSWIGVVAVLIGVSVNRIAVRGFFDPDDFLRLVEVRDLLGGQAWFDLTQYRINPPHGAPMHWSRIVDAPLALVIALFTPLIGAYHAETVALIMVPMVTLGCVMAATMRLTAHYFDRDAAILAGVSTILAPATLAQLNPLRIDHHGWQIACVMLAVTSPIVVRGRNRAAFVAGLAFAVSLSISIEALPLAGAFGAILAWGWLRDPAGDRRLAWFMAALASGLEVLFLATKGPGAIQPWCDAIAPAHIAFFLVAAFGITAAARFAPPRPLFVLAAMGLSGIAAAAVFASMAPACLGAPFGALDPVVMKYWYSQIGEGNPIWTQSPLGVTVSAIPVALGFIGLIAIWRRAAPPERRFWNEYLIFCIAALLTALLVWRSIGFVGALVAVGLGWVIRQVFEWAKYDRTASERGELPKRYLTIAAGIVIFNAVMWWPRPEDPGSKKVQQLISAGTQCDSPSVLSVLNRLPPQTIFAPLDISPTILSLTGHSVVASNHHRANMAIHDVIVAFISPPDAAYGIIASHKAGLVVICSDIIEPGNYTRYGPKGLMADIKAGRVPAWLQPVDLGQPKALLIYKVRPLRQP